MSVGEELSNLIEGIPIIGWSAPTLLSIVVLMLLTGKLWTKAAYDEKVKEAERWRAAYEAEREARVTANSQTTELLELAKTTHSFIVAVFSNSERARQAGEFDVASKE